MSKHNIIIIGFYVEFNKTKPSLNLSLHLTIAMYVNECLAIIMNYIFYTVARSGMYIYISDSFVDDPLIATVPKICEMLSFYGMQFAVFLRKGYVHC